MSDPRHAIGRAAENAAAAWLAGAGWLILDRRLRAGAGGEVDLIALDPAMTLVAIEVRARRTHRTGEPATTVDGRRVRRLESTLIAYARARDVRHRGLRVDLVSAEPVAAPATGWRLRRLPGIGGP
jgi:putative endonuclease